MLIIRRHYFDENQFQLNNQWTEDSALAWHIFGHLCPYIRIAIFFEEELKDSVHKVYDFLGKMFFVNFIIFERYKTHYLILTPSLLGVSLQDPRNVCVNVFMRLLFKTLYLHCTHVHINLNYIKSHHSLLI